MKSSKTLTAKGYLIGLAVIFSSAYSQYLFSSVNLVFGAFVVYGASILVITIICGSTILKKAFSHSERALKLGLSLFGVFSVAGTVAGLIILYLILDIDPAAGNALGKPIPVLNVPHRLAWIMVGVSILVVGPAEEYIFRGFVYGGLLSLFQGRHWILLACVSSVLFAGVHLYYALALGVASLIPFAEIVALGLAFAFTYYLTGGNLLIPALLHGVFDATGFLAVATTPQLGGRLRGALVLLCLIVAFTQFRRRRSAGR